MSGGISKILRRLARFTGALERDTKRLFEEFRREKRGGDGSSKKVLLIRPPFVSLEFGPPLGLAYLQDILKKNGHRALVWDLNLELRDRLGLDDYNREWIIAPGRPVVKEMYAALEENCERALNLDPDIVGFSLGYPTYDYGVQMAKKIHRRVRCIAGGPHASNNEQGILDLGCFDTVVSGYGEEGVLKAVNQTGVIQERLDPQKDYRPDYTGIGCEKYDGFLPILTTRGCPNRCTFCTQNYPYYYHSIASVVEQLTNAGRLKKVMLNDSNLNVNGKRTAELFSALAGIQDPPDIEVFGLQIRPDFERYVSKMARAGVRRVRLGLESGSPRERESMGKPGFDNDLCVAMIKELTAHKILTLAQFIFCYPDQTQEDRRQTLLLIQRINRQGDPEFVRHYWYRFVIYIGKEEFFRRNYGVTSASPVNWQNDLYTPEKVEELQRQYTALLPSNAEILL